MMMTDRPRRRTGEFISVSAGYGYTCGVRRDGSVECWGLDDHGQATPPEGEFASVSAGLHHTCGVRRDGSVLCWGWGLWGQATPPEGEFTSVGAGGWHTCGVRRGRLRSVLGPEYHWRHATGGRVHIRQRRVPPHLRRANGWRCCLLGR